METMEARLIEIVGQDRVVADPVGEESFSLSAHLIPPFAPALRVTPQNVDQVQQIVVWANETRTPLVPVSSGGPHLRGGTLPTAPCAVIVDLSAMKRILKIDHRNRLALVEPGVTFNQLQPALRQEGLRLIAPLLPRAGKSVVAALLEREPVTSPRYQWNLTEPLRSLEIVWGNGERFYSGGGTLRGEREEDWQRGLVPLVGPGPGQLDFYKLLSAAQGTMGIVTWASVKCEVYPDVHLLRLVAADRLEDLIDLTYRLLRFRFGDELFIVNSTCLSWLLGRDAQQDASLAEALPPWTVVVGITGGPILGAEKAAAREADIADIAHEFGLALVPDVPGYRGDELLARLLDPPAEPYWRLRPRGGAQELFFLTTLDRTPGHVATVQAAADEQGYPPSDIGVYLQPAHQGTGCHCEFVLPFRRDSQAEIEQTAALFRDAGQRLHAGHAYFSRPYGIWAGMVYGADDRTRVVTRQIKEIFDPNGVMNPGKLCF
ncbi:MAG TPA: FAD-binding oxidoreductase [Anaerolineae bacterium]|nr:FAD-binding oxidoreductase [Anaerolineae bacterium]